MRIPWAMAGLMVSAFPAAASLIDTVGSDPDARSVLESHYIPCASTGEVRVAIGELVRLFNHSNLVDHIQSAYARQLPAGERPEFVVQTDGSNRWHYVNKSGQHSEIHELARTQDARAGVVEVVYFSRGRRFFGDFRALIHVRIVGDGGSGFSRYESQVWAYPESALPRFFARHLGLVESFFRDKTSELTELSVRICDGLVASPDPAGRVARSP